MTNQKVNDTGSDSNTPPNGSMTPPRAFIRGKRAARKVARLTSMLVPELMFEYRYLKGQSGGI